MIRTIIRVLFVASLVAGVASCKKKEGETGSASSGGAAPATKAADNPPAPASTGIPECDAYVKAMEKFVTCDKLGPAKEAYAKSLATDRDSFSHATDKAATAEQCKKAMSDLAAGAKDRGCPLE